ncbi:NAD-dependent epimerase/dehydratase family protein [Kribbella lupini]|uniref:NAD-dependent epimerase/dehydratase family protein n=1 Tax=Kribbella lupini TaxID=291602 RepID=A0ABP4LC33_9ACTN
MRVVITGASGSVGTALTRRLRRSGGYDVVGIARRIPDGARGDGITWWSVDLSRADCGESLQRAVRNADAVVHLTWAFQPSHRVDYLEAVGVGGTQRVLDAVAAEGVAHLVHMSSVGAYAAKRDDGAPVDESWPVAAVPSSSYSRHKVAAERLLDDFERSADAPVVARLRPGIIGQASAGSALLRYGVPALVPAGALNALPVLPLPDGMTVSMVHADDVADAIARILDAGSAGAFNLAAEVPATADLIAEVLGARRVPVPFPVVRTAMAAAWHARLQPVSPGWLDLGYAVPALDSARARDELGWKPTKDARTVLEETVAGMHRVDSGTTDVLRRRTVFSELSELIRRGPVSHRREP